MYQYSLEQQQLVRGYSIQLPHTLQLLVQRAAQLFALDHTQFVLLRQLDLELLHQDIISDIQHKEVIEVYCTHSYEVQDEQEEHHQEETIPLLPTQYRTHNLFTASYEDMFIAHTHKDSMFAALVSFTRHIQCYKHILPHLVDIHSTLNITSIASANWIVILCMGGKFAAAYYKAGKKISQKCFSRYVQRKKQGKRQANHDKKGATASSAGSYIRRFHENKLQEEIEELLRSWEPYFDSAHLIFVFAPGSINKNSIFFENGPISNNDERIRSIPMSIKTANSVELDQVFSRLSTIRIASTIDQSKANELEEKSA